MVVHAFITSKLDHCNSLYFGLPKYQVKRLQQLQNTAARFVTKAGKYDHIIPLLVELHWLPVSYRIVFKLLLLVYKILNGLCPSYLSNFVQYQTATRSLRSNSQELLIQPMAKTKSYGDRAFTVCAPELWNKVPLTIRKACTVPLLKGSLKPVYFPNLLIITL